jgi:hypothetical protein
LKKLSEAGIVSVADYLGSKKFVLVDELDLTGDEINSISAVVNTFISRNDEPEVVEEVVEAPAEEVVEEVVEAPAEEVVEEVVEAPAEEVVEEVVEAPAEEVVEEVVEAPAEEVVEKEEK